MRGGEPVDVEEETPEVDPAAELECMDGPHELAEAREVEGGDAACSTDGPEGGPRDEPGWGADEAAPARSDRRSFEGGAGTTIRGGVPRADPCTGKNGLTVGLDGDRSASERCG